jgi:hypothetical protein
MDSPRPLPPGPAPGQTRFLATGANDMSYLLLPRSHQVRS